MNIPHPLPRRIGTWTLQAVVAAVFFAAGAMKLAAVPSEVQLFAQIGLGQWFRVVTGVVQIVGAFALVYPGLASIGSLWLGFTMFCAVVANVAVRARGVSKWRTAPAMLDLQHISGSTRPAT
jgi:putative oxidoreductase